MPELPELELLRRDLDREIGERKVKSVEVPVAGVVKHPTKKALIGALEGMKLTGVTRRGMLLSIGVEGTHRLVLSLGDRSRLTRNQPKDAMAPGTALVISFTQGGQLRLVDPKKEATVEYVVAEERAPDLAIGVRNGLSDPLAEVAAGLAVAQFHRLARTRGGP
jgi:formamidopyrimidine-DNA glycosylase